MFSVSNTTTQLYDRRSLENGRAAAGTRRGVRARDMLNILGGAEPEK